MNFKTLTFLEKIAAPLIVIFAFLVFLLIVSFLRKRKREKENFFENWFPLTLNDLYLNITEGALNEIYLKDPSSRLESLGKPSDGSPFSMIYSNYGLEIFLEKGKIISFSFDLNLFDSNALPYRFHLKYQNREMLLSSQAHYTDLVAYLGSPTSENRDKHGWEIRYSDPVKNHETCFAFNSEGKIERCDLDSQ